MKKLIWLSLLGFIGCTKNPVSQHQIVCLDNKNPFIVTVNIVANGGVGAFVIKGHSVLAYRDSKGKTQVIFLSKNDCEVY